MKQQLKESNSVTLFFSTKATAMTFAAEAGLCMIDHAEFDPAKLLTMLANAAGIRAGFAKKKASK